MNAPKEYDNVRVGLGSLELHSQNNSASTTDSKDEKSIGASRGFPWGAGETEGGIKKQKVQTVMKQLPIAESLEIFLSNPDEYDPKPEFVSSSYFRDDDTALIWAIRTLNYNAVLKLCRAGANPNAYNKRGNSPLSVAAHKGRLDIVRVLVEAGADVNGTNDTGATPLIQASHFGHLEVVRYLLLKKANPLMTNNKGTTALMRGAQEGYQEIVSCLLAASQGTDVNWKNLDGMTALMLGSQRGHATTVRVLVRAGADIDDRTGQGSTALMLASKRGHVAVVAVLIAAGAEIYMKDLRGRTAGDTALRRQHLETAKWLNTRVQVESVRKIAHEHRAHVFDSLREAYAGDTAPPQAELVDTALSMYALPNPAARTKPPASVHTFRNDYEPWHWIVLLRRCLALPREVYQYLVAFIPLPRMWLWQLSMLTKRVNLAPEVAIRDLLVLADEMLNDLHIFRGPSRKDVLIALSQQPEVMRFLVQRHAMDPQLLQSLVMWADVQSLLGRVTASMDVAFGRAFAKQFFDVVVRLYLHIMQRENPPTLCSTPWSGSVFSADPASTTDGCLNPMQVVEQLSVPVVPEDDESLDHSESDSVQRIVLTDYLDQLHGELVCESEALPAALAPAAIPVLPPAAAPESTSLSFCSSTVLSPFPISNFTAVVRQTEGLPELVEDDGASGLHTRAPSDTHASSRELDNTVDPPITETMDHNALS